MVDLIVNADDFGKTDGINRGILEAHTRGIVTSTTVMANFEAAESGIEMAMRTAPDLGLGLHLNLTTGRPVSSAADVPSLVDHHGVFHQPGVQAEFGPPWTASDIDREYRAQLARFVELAGKLPTHFDAHHHAAYFHPETLRVMLTLAEENDLPIRRPIFLNAPDNTPVMIRQLWPGYSLAEARAAADAVQGIIRQNTAVRMPQRFEASFYDEGVFLGHLMVLMTTQPAEGVAEIMCHPGYAEGLDSKYTVQRERELSMLTHPSTNDLVATEKIRLISFADLAR